MKRDFEFDGSGFGYLWLCIWTTVLTVITCGLFFPWAYSAQQRWICSNTYVNGRQLRFEGTGPLPSAFTFRGAIASLNAGKPATPYLRTEN